MRRVLLALVCALLSLPAVAQAEPARSVISLNLCTDQLVLALAEPRTIMGISPYGRGRTVGAGAAPILSGSAEEVLLLRPDLVVGGLWDRSATQELIRRQGIRIETFDIVRDLAEARRQIARMGALLGAEARARRLEAEIDAALSRLRAAAARRPLRVLSYARRGWAEGSDSLLGELLEEAGLVNAAGEAGLRAGGFLGLEAVVRLRPDALLLAGEESPAEDQGSALLLHPAIAALFPPERLLRLPGSMGICGGPALAAAIGALAERIEMLTPR